MVHFNYNNILYIVNTQFTYQVINCTKCIHYVVQIDGAKLSARNQKNEAWMVSVNSGNCFCAPQYVTGRGVPTPIKTKWKTYITGRRCDYSPNSQKWYSLSKIRIYIFSYFWCLNLTHIYPTKLEYYYDEGTIGIWTSVAPINHFPF